MLYVQLDANWPDNPKLIEAGLEGAGLHAVAMCIAKRLDTDGWVDRRLLHRQGADDVLIDRLVTLELFDADAGRVRVHDWLDRNPSQAAIAARRAAKTEGARRGNHKKWEHPGEYEDCAICQAKAQVVASSEQPASHTDRLASPYTESESESESEPSDAIPAATTVAERQDRIAAACRADATNRYPGKGDGYLNAAANGIATDYHQHLHAHLVAHPTATVDELVQVIVGLRKPAEPEPVNTSAHIPRFEPPEPMSEEEREASRQVGKAVLAELRRKEPA